VPKVTQRYSSNPQSSINHKLVSVLNKFTSCLLLLKSINSLLRKIIDHNKIVSHSRTFGKYLCTHCVPIFLLKDVDLHMKDSKNRTAMHEAVLQANR
jgi:hypothetical protein